jgi:hypothetical protein
LQSFAHAVTGALELNPNVAIEAFINKVDGELFLSDESKYDCWRDIMTQVTDDAGVSLDSVHIRHHLIHCRCWIMPMENTPMNWSVL